MFLQFFNCLLDLYYLIRLCHFAVTLQVNTRITRPWRFKYMVAARNPWFAKVLSADVQQIVKRYAAGAIKVDIVFSHGLNDSVCAIITP